jgi:hypothetical protein
MFGRCVEPRFSTYTERVLSQAAVLEQAAFIAGRTHERLDPEIRSSA